MPTSAELATSLADYDKNKVTSTDALNDALKQYGVPEIRQNVAGLRTTVANTTNALNSVDPSVTGRTQGSLVTEAQRQRQVVNERAPIAEQLQGFNQALGQGEQNLNEANQQATTLATNRVHDYETGRNALKDRFDIAYKGEQDAAAAEAQRQASAQDQRNKDREYQLAVQAANTRSSAASSKGPSKTDVANHIVQQFNGNKGRDGKVSNETWANALNDWTASGGTVRQFWQNYSMYVNGKYVKSYAGYSAR